MWINIDNPLTPDDYLNVNLYPRIFYNQRINKTMLDDNTHNPLVVAHGNKVKEILELNTKLPINAVVVNLEEALKDYVDNV